MEICIQGSWSTSVNNVDQWIMVELASIYTVTDIATQGMYQIFKHFNQKICQILIT